MGTSPVSDTWGAPLVQGHPICLAGQGLPLALAEKQPLGRRWGKLPGSSRVFQAHGNRVGKDTAPGLMKAGRIFSGSPRCCCAGSQHGRAVPGLGSSLESWAGPHESPCSQGQDGEFLVTTQQLGQSPGFQPAAELGGCQEGVKALEALTNITGLRRNVPGVGLGRETTLANTTETCLDLGGF